MDLGLTEAQEILKTTVADFVQREYDKNTLLALENTPTGITPELLRKVAELGWLGVVIPEAYGGAGLGVTEAVLMLEAICASGAGLSGASPVHFSVFPPMPIIRHGSEALKRRILPEIAAGRLSLAFGVTEPNAGTDTSRIETTARKDGRDWVVGGRKA